MKFCNYFLFLQLEPLLTLALSFNYIVNGGFEDQVVPPSSYISNNLTRWNGSNFDLTNMYSTLGYNQYIDLQQSYGQNGYIEQTIPLPSQGNCTLSFLQQAYDDWYFYYQMEVYWNGQLLRTQIPNTTATTLEVIEVIAVAGNNVVMFKEVGDSNDNSGMFIDQVSLTCNLVNHSKTLNYIGSVQDSLSVVEYIISIIFSTFSNLIAGVRIIYLYCQDMWLFYYDKVEHEGLINQVFKAIAAIQLLKFNIFQRILHWQKNNANLPISDYTSYTRLRFVKVQNSSHVIVKAIFSFFIYTVPENIVMTLVFYFLFRLTSNYKISVYFRKFYFIKSALLQTLIEGNVCYFCYLCLSHLSTPFSFHLGDKLSLALTVVFFWAILMYCFVFYYLLAEYLKKKAGYFLSYVYRCNRGLMILTLKNLVRNLLRGTVFYFFHESYGMQIILLITIQVGLILVLISLAPKSNVFMSRSFYSLTMIYHFLFILLNLSLYLGYLSTQNGILKELALQFQTVFIYLLSTTILLMVLCDIAPIEWFRSKKKSSKSLSNKKKKQRKKQNKRLKQRYNKDHQIRSRFHPDHNHEQNQQKDQQISIKFQISGLKKVQVFKKNNLKSKWTGAVKISKKHKEKKISPQEVK